MPAAAVAAASAVLPRSGVSRAYVRYAALICALAVLAIAAIKVIVLSFVGGLNTSQCGKNFCLDQRGAV